MHGTRRSEMLLAALVKQALDQSKATEVEGGAFDELLAGLRITSEELGEFVAENRESVGVEVSEIRDPIVIKALDGTQRFNYDDRHLLLDPRWHWNLSSGDLIYWRERTRDPRLIALIDSLLPEGGR